MGSDTEDVITSNEDKGQKPALLHAVQDALVHSTDARKVLLNTRTAMENSGGDPRYFYWMVEFIDIMSSTYALLKSKLKKCLGRVVSKAFLSN